VPTAIQITVKTGLPSNEYYHLTMSLTSDNDLALESQL